MLPVCFLYRFGDGYTLTLRVSGRNPNMASVMSFIQRTFHDCQLQERYHNMIQYQLKSEQVSLASIFGTMEKARNQLNIEDYSVSQTTLDQVREREIVWNFVTSVALLLL